MNRNPYAAPNAPVADAVPIGVANSKLVKWVRLSLYFIAKYEAVTFSKKSP